MDEKRLHPRIADPIFPGPHQEFSGDYPADFVPLSLVFHPGQIRVELKRPELVIGRHTQADIRLVLPDVSRRHCRLVFEEGQWRIYDLDSLNGVYINGERMVEATLYEGDTIRLGSFRFTVEKGAAPRVVTMPRPEDPRQMIKSIADSLPPKEEKKSQAS